MSNNTDPDDHPTYIERIFDVQPHRPTQNSASSRKRAQRMAENPVETMIAASLISGLRAGWKLLLIVLGLMLIIMLIYMSGVLV